MDLRQLRYFAAVAEEKGFSKAADRLNMAQPPLSRAIQQLEAELRVDLIDRSQRPLVLTPAGEILYEQSLQVLRRVEDMRAMMAVASASERRRFTIGFVASTIYGRLPPLIREFRAAFPGVDLHLVESVTLRQIASLKEGRIDVGFGRVRFADPAIVRTVLRREKLVVAVPLGSAIGRDGQAVSLGSLVNERVILYPAKPRPSYADQVISLFHDNGLRPDIVHEASELQIAIGLVAAEEGIAIVPDAVRRARSEDIRYVDLIEPASSPIIMNHRLGDASPELVGFMRIIARKYREWGYPVPDVLTEL